MGELQKHRNAKQVRGSAGEREKHFVQERGNAKAKSRVAEAHRNARSSLVIFLFEFNHERNNVKVPVSENRVE